MKSPEFKKRMDEVSRKYTFEQIDRTVTGIEMYKLRHGIYPDSLAQLPKGQGMTVILLTDFDYERIDTTYALDYNGRGIGLSALSGEDANIRLPESYWRGLGCVRSNLK